MNDADFWELLTKHGIRPDSATAIVQSHRGMSDADLWERLVKNGAPSDAATQMVQSRGGSSAPLASPAADDTGLSLRNLGRSAVQGATFGFGDELHLTDRPKETAFKAQHPVADFLAKMAGGVVAPAVAVAAAPELGATAGGAAVLGGVSGLLSGAGEADGSMADRAKGAAVGGLLGAAGGAAAHYVAKGAGAVSQAIGDRVHPERVVRRAVASVVSPADAARLADVERVAPGGGSLVTAAIPAEGDKASRLLPMLRGVGANAPAAARAEGNIMAQKAALKTATDQLGSQMDAVRGTVPVTPPVRRVLEQVSEILGKRAPEAAPPRAPIPAVPDQVIPAMTTAQSPAPDLRTAVSDFWTRLGVAAKRGEGTVEQRMARQALERHGAEASIGKITGGASATVIPGTPEQTFPATVDIQDLRDGLSRLRFMSRQAATRGVDANGMTLKDITDAESALRSVVYQHAPELQTLDQPYAIASNAKRQADQALKAIQRSRANYAANDAFSASSGSIGGSLPHGTHSVIMHALDKLFTNKSGAADAVSTLLTKPGGADLVTQLLQQIKTPRPVGRVAVPLASGLIPGMRGLLSPSSP